MGVARQGIDTQRRNFIAEFVDWQWFDAKLDEIAEVLLQALARRAADSKPQEAGNVGLSSERIWIVKPTGEVGPYSADINYEVCYVFDVKADIEEGDTIRRPLPNGRDERYVVEDVTLRKGDWLDREALRLRIAKVSRRDLTGSSPVQGASAMAEADLARGPRIFISHSSRDTQTASALIDLLTRALALRSESIRCTSVAGFELDAGANAENQLKAEVVASEVLISLISEHSLQSTYVMFELGARWGFGRPLIPILVGAILPGDLRAPLSALHAVRGDSEERVHSLLDTVAKHLGAVVERPSAYLAQLRLFVKRSGLQIAEVSQEPRS